MQPVDITVSLSQLEGYIWAMRHGNKLTPTIKGEGGGVLYYCYLITPMGITVGYDVSLPVGYASLPLSKGNYFKQYTMRSDSVLKVEEQLIVGLTQVSMITRSHSNEVSLYINI